MARIADLADRRFDVIPAPFIIETATDQLGDERAALARAHPAIQLCDQIIFQGYVQPHGLIMTHNCIIANSEQVAHDGPGHAGDLAWERDRATAPPPGGDDAQAMAEELAELAENARLRALLGMDRTEDPPAGPWRPTLFAEEKPTADRRPVNRSATREEKVALFRSLFVGRPDVYASKTTVEPAQSPPTSSQPPAEAVTAWS